MQTRKAFETFLIQTVDKILDGLISNFMYWKDMIVKINFVFTFHIQLIFLF